MLPLYWRKEPNPQSMKATRFSSIQFLQKIAYVLLLPLLFAGCTSEPKLPSADEAETAVMAKVIAAAEKWSSGDHTGYLDCAAEDISWVDDIAAQECIFGLETLKDYFANFEGQVPPHKYELINPVFQNFGDMVVLTYRYQGVFDTIVADPWNVTAVYRFADGDWKSVHENWWEVAEKK